MPLMLLNPKVNILSSFHVIYQQNCILLIISSSSILISLCFSELHIIWKSFTIHQLFFLRFFWWFLLFSTLHISVQAVLILSCFVKMHIPSVSQGFHMSSTSGAPNLWAMKLYLLSCQWWHQIRSKVHNKCNVFELFWDHPPHRSVEKLSSMKLVPGAKKVGDSWILHDKRASKFCISSLDLSLSHLISLPDILTWKSNVHLRIIYKSWINNLFPKSCTTFLSFESINNQLSHLIKPLKIVSIIDSTFSLKSLH